MDENFSFGYWLRRQRLARDLRQDDLARQLSIATVTLRKLEADERRPSLQLIARIAALFRLDEPEHATLRRVARADLSPIALPLPQGAAPSNNHPGPSASSAARLQLLPAAPNALIGREAELLAIAALLDDADARLLTLIGPGGTGKTRLALHAARELEQRFADGVCFIDLTPIRDPALVLPTIGRTLGLQEHQQQALADTLAAFLRPKQLLLVLDNCEHVIAAAPEVAALLAAAPQVRMIATSREALRISAERLYWVAPLIVPAASDDSLGAPAAQLFLARARAERSDLALTGEVGAAVAAICRRLDGLPLALELAAARLHHLTPHALLRWLEHPLDLLTSGARDLPARQQTLRATIAWSYDLLTHGEQALFRRLGVFVGGWNLAAAEAVGALGTDTLGLLSGLIDKSLVQPNVGVGDEPRYTMLETIREYALEQLAANGEAEATGERHAEYFLTLAERVRPEEYGPHATLWLDRLDEEHANLRAAMTLSRERRRYERLARFCTALRWFWFLRAHIAEAVFWLAQAEAHQAQLSPLTRARVLLDCAYFLPDQSRRCALIAPGLALFRALGDRRELAWALTTVSGMHYFYGDGELARRPAEESLPLARALGEPALLADALHCLGQIRMFDGAFDDARRLCEEALGINLALGDQQAISYNLYALGEIAGQLRRYAQAEACFSESARLRRAQGDRRGMAAQLMNASDVVRLQGDVPRALAMLHESLTVFRDIGWVQGIGWVHQSLIEIASQLGQYEQSARFLGVEEAIRTALGYTNNPLHRTEEDEAKAATQAHLSADAFAVAFAAGQALSVETAAAEALAWLEAAQRRLLPTDQPNAGLPARLP